METYARGYAESKTNNQAMKMNIEVKTVASPTYPVKFIA